MAAKGQIAFATSFEPCAKERRHAEKTRGILKSLFMDFLEFLNISSFFSSNIESAKIMRTLMMTAMIRASFTQISITFPRPFIAI